MMAFNRPNPLSTLSLEDERYLNQPLSPQSRPIDLFPTKGAEPLPGHWSYDSTIDLFSLNPADMDSVSFDFADSLTNADTKDLFMDPFGTPTAISGFTMPTSEDTVSLSSDLDSDDQSWSAGARPSIDMAMLDQTPTEKTRSKPTTRQSTQSNASSTRWSSSPEIKPQEYIAPRADRRAQPNGSRKARSLSDDSHRSSSTSQDTQGRNAAKRAAHNIIEKRYRTNMNAKFLALEKAISPAAVHKQAGRAGAGSLKKSEILTNALTYIEGIQQENQAMQKELALLKQNLLGAGMWRPGKHPRA
ncbi:hypothetical protein N7462_001329 [Penicillium macrosclerotiorum]|uniref:uncharacterized protein n=1 Tax=Penicillium macrosclerotiorum TaxID=303699 RepID=UPI002549AF06|nr:uncharacterized protein N7462_001329 [Penicillium macrosclerotiorum]KAJ5691906.1 hypothetical protein N7462_001329 [Penicillium macrosclerotiorum]